MFESDQKKTVVCILPTTFHMQHAKMTLTFDPATENQKGSSSYYSQLTNEVSSSTTYKWSLNVIELKL